MAASTPTASASSDARRVTGAGAAQGVIGPARTGAEIAAVRSLMADYAAGLGVDLSFQGFAAELAALPGPYAPPGGALLLARGAEGTALGCVALRPGPAPGTCEMKRLYVAPAARGGALGRRLAEAALDAARAAGYRRIVLDTLAGMETAQALYDRLGFADIAPYCDNPLPGTRWMGRAL